MSSEIALEPGTLAARLLEDLLALARIADHARRDQQDQLRLLDLLLRASEEIAEHRNTVQERDTDLDDASAALDEPTEDERTA